MIGALAEGLRVPRRAALPGRGQRAARFLPARAPARPPDGRLLRTCRAGKAHLDAYLEDYAYLADGAPRPLRGGRRRAPFLREAERLAERIRADFAAEDGRLLLHRPRPRAADRPPPRGARRRHPGRQRRRRARAGAALVPPRPRGPARARRCEALRAWGKADRARSRARSPRAWSRWTSCSRVRSSSRSWARRATGARGAARASWPATTCPTASSRSRSRAPARRTCPCSPARRRSAGGPRSTSAATSPASAR